jgi:hypothetical protein
MRSNRHERINGGRDYDEIIRRLRVGDLRRYLRCRYGAVLPDDDAGREDLYELLLPISLGPRADRVMRNTIEVWAPWASASEADAMIGMVLRTRPCERMRPAKMQGEILSVTNADRDRHRLWTIAPADMDAAQMAEHRKAKRRKREQERRRRAGRKPRAAYLAESLTKQKPWEAEGISRPTWYRRRKAGLRQEGDTNGRQCPKCPQLDA